MLFKIRVGGGRDKMGDIKLDLCWGLHRQKQTLNLNATVAKSKIKGKSFKKKKLMFNKRLVAMYHQEVVLKHRFFFWSKLQSRIIAVF